MLTHHALEMLKRRTGLPMPDESNSSSIGISSAFWLSAGFADHGAGLRASLGLWVISLRL
jgi:hypothetical protein